MRIDLQPNTVHVVEIAVQEPPASAAALLDPAERDRAARFAFDADRTRFVASHAGMRLALGSCLRQDPASLRFATDRLGKPRLFEPPFDIRFNLAHSGERALLAIALGRDVGVDIEKERSVDVLALGRRYFAASELQALVNTPPPRRLAAFFRCWTRKEAFIKALGEGLYFPLDGFEVSVADDESGQLLKGCAASPAAPARWRIVSIPVDAPYTAALAAEQGEWRVVRWTLSGSALDAPDSLPR